tara:strand:- start:449 stop:1162 length:714 start_codon:yes stop_codon:yes gene_type:complete
MAKKADKEISDPYERIISKVIEPFNPQKGRTDSTYATTLGQGWQVLAANPLGCYYEDSIDLSGYANQDLTFFPELAFSQMSPFYTILSQDGGAVLELLAITSVPLDVESLYTSLIFGSAPALPELSAPGITNTTPIDWSTVPYCKIDFRSRNDNTPGGVGVMQLIESAQLGSLQPTAADKLFIYRIVVPYSNTAPFIDFESMVIPALRVGFRGMMAQEDDREYLMRLKRGYELANQV